MKSELAPQPADHPHERPRYAALCTDQFAIDDLALEVLGQSAELGPEFRL
jgi:hypothetical protein